MPKLVANNITKQYPTRSQPLVVLGGVSLALDPGENLAILGPSGSGKSTLLSIIGTLENPTSGRVTLDGVDPATLDERGLAAFRSRRIGFVFQDHYLLPQCSVLENVLLPAVPLGAVSDETVRRAEMLLERVGLSDRSGHRPAELSGGERQRGGFGAGADQRPRTAFGRRTDRQPRPHDRPTGRRVARRDSKDGTDDADRRHAQRALGGNDAEAAGVG